mgnify:CR=1 FL=1
MRNLGTVGAMMRYAQSARGEMGRETAVAEDKSVVICVEDRSNSESKRHNFQGTRPNGGSARARVLGCKRYIKGGKGWTENERGRLSQRAQKVQNQGRILKSKMRKARVRTDDGG